MAGDFADAAAEIRRRYAPRELHPKSTWARCRRCETWFLCWRVKIKPYCIDCAAARERESWQRTRERNAAARAAKLRGT